MTIGCYPIPPLATPTECERPALEIADHLDVATRVGPVTADELRTASEIFLTNTAGGIMLVAYR